MEVYREKQVCAKTQLSRSTLYRKEHAGEFPQRIRLGAASVGWLVSEIDGWLASRPRGMAAAPSTHAAATVEA